MENAMRKLTPATPKNPGTVENQDASEKKVEPVEVFNLNVEVNGNVMTPSELRALVDKSLNSSASILPVEAYSIAVSVAYYNACQQKKWGILPDSPECEADLVDLSHANFMISDSSAYYNHRVNYVLQRLYRSSSKPIHEGINGFGLKGTGSYNPAQPAMHEILTREREALGVDVSLAELAEIVSPVSEF